MALTSAALLDPSLRMPAAPTALLARSARFSDGAEHARRRELAIAALPAVDGLHAAACDSARSRLSGDLDVMPLLREVPVEVLATAMGVAVDSPDVAPASLLHQCRDATAALLVAALVGDDRPPVILTRRVDADGRLHDVLLDDAPWGAGVHACPGRAHAEALAAGVREALTGWHVVEIGGFEDRPTMRLPSTLRMAR